MATKRTKARRTPARAKRPLRRTAPKVARAISSDAGEVTSKPMLLGYARVSTVDQNLALQRDALTEAGCTKIFTEQMSGAVADRPALHDALEFARSGNTLIRKGDPDPAHPVPPVMKPPSNIGCHIRAKCREPMGGEAKR